MPPRRTVLVTIASLLVLAVAMAVQPYILPTAIALGPCGRDWTSPSSYLPRSSPTRSVSFSVAGASAKICYGSPSARGRTIFGELVPWDQLWRTGANEPTRLFTDGPLNVAGIEIDAGRFSLYTIPGPAQWQVFLTGSTFHWGNAISSSVRAQEIGKAQVEVQAVDTGPVERLVFHWQPHGAGGKLVLEWETTRIEIPVEAAANSTT